MEFIGMICIFLVLAWLSFKLGKFFEDLARDREAREKRDELFKQALLDNTSAIRDGMPKEEQSQESDAVKLLKANQELMYRKKVQQAMEDELGIK